MKKTLLLLLLVLLALCLPLSGCKKKAADVPEPPPDETGADVADPLDDWVPEPEESSLILVGQVLSDSVNVRQSASTSSTSLGKVARGDLLLILKSGTTAGSSGGSWYEVRYGGKSGYIHADYLSAQEMAEDSVVVIGTVVNVDSVLNIRAEPNAQSQRVGRANRGDKFVVVNQDAGDGSWSKIEYTGGVEGIAYVKSEYLNVAQQMIINLLTP